MQTGKLPDQMVLDNNDEDWYDEAEEVDEAVDLEGTEFPLRLGKNLQGTNTTSLSSFTGSFTGPTASILRPSGQMCMGACLFLVPSREAGGDLFVQLLPHAFVAILHCWKGSLVPAVLRLGRIEWMRPTYHTKKHIYPVGYSAVRAVELSAMRGNFVECLCEILEGPDRLAPVFRCEP